MKNLHLKVGLFVTAVILIILGFLVYWLDARGLFENKLRFKLATASADGIAPGMPVTFSGMPIGQITAVDLNEAGGILISAEVAEKESRWLREDSGFTLDKPIVGGGKIRVSTPDLTAPALVDGATVLLQTSDPIAEVPVLVARIKSILANVERLTAQDSALAGTLSNVNTVTARMTGEYGVLEGMLGGPDKARPVIESLKKTDALLARLNTTTARVDGLLAKTDSWLFAPGGLTEQTRESLVQVRGLLDQARGSLQKADTLMQNAVDISADVKTGTEDIAALRAEIDEAARTANDLLNEINRKWPFARDPRIKLP
jgi:phospholipid/cholesterol/gamma-HCH transport system substrate-binding protein